METKLLLLIARSKGFIEGYELFLYIRVPRSFIKFVDKVMISKCWSKENVSLHGLCSQEKKKLRHPLRDIYVLEHGRPEFKLSDCTKVYQIVRKHCRFQ